MSDTERLEAAAGALEQRATYREAARGIFTNQQRQEVAEDRAVAALLREVAENAKYHIAAWQRPGDGEHPPAVFHNDLPGLAANIEHHYGRALAVADAVLGAGTPDGEQQ